MNEVYIVGAGGLAAELTEYVKDNNLKMEEQVSIKGYFDVSSKAYLENKFSSPYLGDERDYSFSKGSAVLIAIGDVKARNRCIEYFSNLDVLLPNFIHHSAFIASSVNMKGGNIICPNVIIGPNVILGQGNLINYSSAIPHDCHIGDVNVFSPNVQITGQTGIGSSNFFGTSVTCLPRIKIGDSNKIQAGIVVKKDIGNGRIIYCGSKNNDIKSHNL
ncbi:sialic acid synthase [Pseudoalteromonas sp. A25]|uniref:PglD-related sugar-binding protein n=1 Tax=Pseudoalteromonas sp. A25 TaxID=116092 RepID=UPI00126070F0|nr:hypothetical protein [Pseudoalteromonas sp. A25]BBN80411.1 sialic acid synthase [Pseudoalteromonas sp. A25]